MIYLASPYTGTNLQQLSRYYDVLEAKCRLLNLGINTYSPIACWHIAAAMNELAPGYATFQQHDEEMIALCDRFNILCLPGWAASNGVARETRYAKLIGRVVEYIYLNDLRNGAYVPRLESLEESHEEV